VFHPRRATAERRAPALAPDLAIEVLSESNTEGEMKRKLKEYFLAGTRAVWFVDPAKRTVQVFSAPDQSVLHTQDDVLDGGAVLPGLSLAVRDVFADVARPLPKPKRGKGRKRNDRGGT
jgi:Uma2 family endonuclease